MAKADLAREAAGSGTDFGRLEAKLRLVLHDDLQQLRKVALVEAARVQVVAVQRAMRVMCHDRLDGILQRRAISCLDKSRPCRVRL
jgi:hypothetical protein